MEWRRDGFPAALILFLGWLLVVKAARLQRSSVRDVTKRQSRLFGKSGHLGYT